MAIPYHGPFHGFDLNERLRKWSKINLSADHHDDYIAKSWLSRLKRLLQCDRKRKQQLDQQQRRRRRRQPAGRWEKASMSTGNAAVTKRVNWHSCWSLVQTSEPVCLVGGVNVSSQMGAPMLVADRLLKFAIKARELYCVSKRDWSNTKQDDQASRQLGSIFQLNQCEDLRLPSSQ